MEPTAPRFRLLERLGGGDTGEVYKAEDLTLGRVVALKILESPGAASGREHLLAEARAVARLSHPGIVTLHELTQRDGQPCIVMEYVEGETLARRIEAGCCASSKISTRAPQRRRAVQGELGAGSETFHCPLRVEAVGLARSGTARPIEALRLPASLTGRAPT